MDAIDFQKLGLRNIFACAHMMFPQGHGVDGEEAPWFPIISHGVKQTLFAEHVSEAEANWLVRVLKDVIFKKTGKRLSGKH